MTMITTSTDHIRRDSDDDDDDEDDDNDENNCTYMVMVMVVMVMTMVVMTSRIPLGREYSHTPQGRRQAVAG